MEDNKKLPGTDGTPTPGQDNGKDGGKSFTQDDMDKLAAKVRAEEKAKTDKAIEERVKAEMEEYDRKAKLTEEEREKEARSKREKELADRESSITLRERKLEAASLLSEKGVPNSFVDYVVDIDQDKMNENIENFSKLFAKEVEQSVTNKMKGTPPKDFGRHKDDDQGKKTEKKVISRAF